MTEHVPLSDDEFKARMDELYRKVEAAGKGNDWSAALKARDEGIMLLLQRGVDQHGLDSADMFVLLSMIGSAVHMLVTKETSMFPSMFDILGL